MTITKTPLDGLLVIEPRVFSDSRGHFFESFNLARFSEATGLTPEFVQDNESLSLQGVLRGLHYQVSPKAQGKLVRVVSGRVWDVAVDIREHSHTFGQWHGLELSAENHKQMWIPPGFAHGFLTLSDTAVFQYKVTDYWNAEHERCIAFNDTTLNIQWPMAGGELIVSDKDRYGLAFSEAPYF